MIQVISIEPLDNSRYEVLVVHRGQEKRFIFQAHRHLEDDLPTVYSTPAQAYVELDEFSLPKRTDGPQGTPENPVVDQLLDLVKIYDVGGQIRLPTIIEKKKYEKLRPEQIWNIRKRS